MQESGLNNTKVKVDMIEEWRTIKNFEDYQISNKGRVKSFKRYTEGKIIQQAQINKATSRSTYRKIIKEKP